MSNYSFILNIEIQKTNTQKNLNQSIVIFIPLNSFDIFV